MNPSPRFTFAGGWNGRVEDGTGEGPSRRTGGRPLTVWLRAPATVSEAPPSVEPYRGPRAAAPWAFDPEIDRSDRVHTMVTNRGISTWIDTEAAPGAHPLVGRLHAAVQRLGGMKRFLVRHLFGAEVLDGTSWDSARRQLEYATGAAPCTPEHHFELARVYADVGEPARARREVEHVLELIGGGDEFEGMRSKAEAFVRELPAWDSPERASDL